MIGIVYDQLVELLGGAPASRPAPTHALAENRVPILAVSPAPIIMMCGLQGSGKTTTCGKLAAYLKKRGRSVMLVAADLQRPAAVEQLPDRRRACRQKDAPAARGSSATPSRQDRRVRQGRRRRRPGLPAASIRPASGASTPSSSTPRAPPRQRRPHGGTQPGQPRPLQPTRSSSSSTP